ncbi:MAG TPA: hypothetical protein VEB70_02030 [Noviherbaspirillum sp.]|nr:hypothetical protein [Noviherbaspirillum sp.]
MLTHTRSIKREEILRLAIKTKLMLDAGNACCINDIAGEKELLAFARLLETRLAEPAEHAPLPAKE